MSRVVTLPVSASGSSAGRAFDRDRYHERQDVCGEFDAAQRACGIPGGGGYFRHGHDTRSTFIMERSIGLDFGARMARYLGSEPSAR
jgi:hypothetical protein